MVYKPNLQNCVVGIPRVNNTRVGFLWRSMEMLIAENRMPTFRRLYMKRRQTDGEYESDWQRIDDNYVKKWGKISWKLDNVVFGQYEQSGVNVSLRNDDAFFNDENDDESFWNGHLSRYRTMVKINAGYLDSIGTEWPTVTTMFVGIINNPFKQSDKNELKLKVDNLNALFKQIPAEDLVPAGTLTGSQTASDLVNYVMDYTDGSSNLVFQKYISAGAWTIETTTTVYPSLDTNTALEGSAWDLLQKLAKTENKVVYIGRPGDFNFVARDAGASTAVYEFHGIGSRNTRYGHNIIRLREYTEAIDKLYNRIRIKHSEVNTSTSYYTKGESWSWGDSSTSNEFGVRTYEFENTFLDSDSSVTLGDALFAEYATVKNEMKLDTKFCPQLNLGDNIVGITYKSTLPPRGALWGKVKWLEFLWGRSSPRTFNIDDESFRITGIQNNLDTLSDTYDLRAL